MCTVPILIANAMPSSWSSSANSLCKQAIALCKGMNAVIHKSKFNLKVASANNSHRGIQGYYAILGSLWEDFKKKQLRSNSGSKTKNHIEQYNKVF